MRQRGHFLPYPHVLKESTLPIHEDVHPLEGPTWSAGQPVIKEANDALPKYTTSQIFETGPQNIQEHMNRSNLPLPIDIPMPPQGAQIGLPQVDPSEQTRVAPAGPVNPVPEQVPWLPVAPTDEPAVLPTLDPMIVPIVPQDFRLKHLRRNQRY